ncbi:MAG TPA: zinc ribbon domain-containing protein, partial [Syntrophobacteraceae bacterium]|nr:zinc ribbon domain-containing protein [Syntrophobacteraceae bacterium]
MENTVLCPNCSKTLPSNAKFCSNCGAAIAGVRSGLQTTSAATEEKPAGGVSIDQPEIQMAASVKRAAEQVRHIPQWGQRIWDIITMGGCGTLSGAWYWYSGMAETQPDYKTCAGIILLPLLLIVFRSAIDRLLMPIQGIRTRVPPLVRLGIG